METVFFVNNVRRINISGEREHFIKCIVHALQLSFCAVKKYQQKCHQKRKVAKVNSRVR